MNLSLNEKFMFIWVLLNVIVVNIIYVILYCFYNNL